MAGRGTNTSINIHKLLTETLLPITIVILSLGITRLNPSINKGAIQRIAHIITTTNRYRTITTCVVIGNAMMRLELFKIRQTILIIPTAGAMGFPFIIIMGITAHVDHAINR